MKKYLSVEEVIFIQKEIVNEFGGIHGIRDMKSLEAEALMESLAMNHPFLDGNKRISFLQQMFFLE